MNVRHHFSLIVDDKAIGSLITWITQVINILLRRLLWKMIETVNLSVMMGNTAFFGAAFLFSDDH